MSESEHMTMEAIKVKGLEWSKNGVPLIAICTVGVYRIWANNLLETPAPSTSKIYESTDAAKAAAQADYEARIRSAIEPVEATVEPVVGWLVKWPNAIRPEWIENDLPSAHAWAMSRVASGAKIRALYASPPSPQGREEIIEALYGKKIERPESTEELIRALIAIARRSLTSP